MKNIPTNLSNFQSKVDKLDFHKLVPVPVDLSKLSDAVKNDVVKKNVYNDKIKNIEDKVSDITNLGTNTTLDAKEKSSITKLATTAALTAIENKIPNVSILVKKYLAVTQKLVKLKIKLILIMIMVNIILFKNSVS